MSSSRISLGSLFQSDDAAAVKALSLSFSFVFEDGARGANKNSRLDRTPYDLRWYGPRYREIWTYRPTFWNTYWARFSKIDYASSLGLQRSELTKYFISCWQRKATCIYNDGSPNFYYDTVHQRKNVDVVWKFPRH